MRFATVSIVIVATGSAMAAPLRIHEARGYAEGAAVLARNRNIIVRDVLQAIYGHEFVCFDPRQNEVSALLMRRADPEEPAAHPVAPPAPHNPDSPPPKYNRPARTALPLPYADRVSPDPQAITPPPEYENKPIGINHAPEAPSLHPLSTKTRSRSVVRWATRRTK
ncbi:hypothetical protein EIP91_001378 [Steccherinum ochraceum]|uniref:Uncharacterized protein n=1 Tax=Steccherinum ochraceum TaxID=92696 RepID=A0A4R0RE92_9APHY|nr:hypothetical protein EIP91_001378 [Steccherinum ochraceum]